MNTAILFSWSIVVIACSNPGFAYYSHPPSNRGPSSTTSSSSCRRHDELFRFSTQCHSPWRHQQQPCISLRDYVRHWGALSSLTRDVTGGTSQCESPTTTVAPSGSGQSEYVRASDYVPRIVKHIILLVCFPIRCRPTDI